MNAKRELAAAFDYLAALGVSRIDMIYEVDEDDEFLTNELTQDEDMPGGVSESRCYDAHGAIISTGGPGSVWWAAHIEFDTKFQQIIQFECWSRMKGKFMNAIITWDVTRRCIEAPVDNSADTGFPKHTRK